MKGLPKDLCLKPVRGVMAIWMFLVLALIDVDCKSPGNLFYIRGIVKPHLRLPGHHNNDPTMLSKIISLKGSDCCQCHILKKGTPPKTNMEPENGPLEKKIPIGNHHFQVPC